MSVWPSGPFSVLEKTQREEILEEMSKQAIADYLYEYRAHGAILRDKDFVPPTDADVIRLWNQRFEATAKKFRHAD